MENDASAKTLDFAPNYAHIIEIDITPDASPTWAWAQRGITSCVPAAAETTEEDAYYHLLGSTETSVNDVKVSIAMTGHRMYGDPAQDFVQSRALLTGDDRKTRYRWTHPDGTVLTGECSLSGLVPGSAMGDANSKGDFSYTINFNTVEKVPGTGDMTAMPTSVTVSDVTAQVGKSVAASATVAPAGANQKCHYAIEDGTIATVDEDGNVTGVKAGETVLTVKAASKPSVVAQAKVKVGTTSSGS